MALYQLLYRDLYVIYANFAISALQNGNIVLILWSELA